MVEREKEYQTLFTFQARSLMLLSERDYLRRRRGLRQFA